MERKRKKVKKKAETQLIASVSAKLQINLAGIKLKNPVLVASGTFNCGEEYSQLYDLEKLGGIITKAVTAKRKIGNPPPRMAETPAGMLNTVGLQNEGVDYFIRKQLPPLLKKDLAVIANVAGSTIEEYVVVAKKLSRFGGLAGIELNVSCPNVHKGGMAFGVDPLAIRDVVSSVRKATTLPIFVKLSPNVTDIVHLARSAMDAGANGLSLINTLLGMAIDIETQKPRLSMKMGGLSGPAIKPIAIRMVYQVYKELKCPIIGMGGISSAEDAIEFMLAGATAIAVGTANFVEPLLAPNIPQQIENYLNQKKNKSINEIIGLIK
ncbi:MAG: dihydroorotate dehydrogenase [Candidatus Margulisbacteria bacterium]|nr:dihydroorotate dehydrogenase [Candidatus Margulisiibacteriota bacterium]